jgi:hypothetical protein
MSEPRSLNEAAKATRSMEPGDQTTMRVDGNMLSALKRVQVVMDANRGREEGTVAVIINGDEVEATCLED